MPEIKVDHVSGSARATHPAFRAMDDVMERIRRRAFDLFSGRGFDDGRALEDWLTAEREICWPAAELIEQDREYVLSVALPGFEPGDVAVTATSGEIIVHAGRQSKETAPATPSSTAKEGGSRGQAARESASKSETGRPAATTVWSEFRSDEVYRRVLLERPIDAGKVTAAMKNGILTITAAKAADAGRVVPISAAA